MQLNLTHGVPRAYARDANADVLMTNIGPPCGDTTCGTRAHTAALRETLKNRRGSSETSDFVKDGEETLKTFLDVNLGTLSHPRAPAQPEPGETLRETGADGERADAPVPALLPLLQPEAAAVTRWSGSSTSSTCSRRR